MNFSKLPLVGLLLAGSVSLPAAVLAADNAPIGDPAAGKALADKVCAACHGIDGNAIVPVYPDLRGQNAEYLVYALKAYKENLRMGGNAGIMQAQATSLSEKQIADLAAYYSGLAAH